MQLATSTHHAAAGISQSPSATISSLNEPPVKLTYVPAVLQNDHRVLCCAMRQQADGKVSALDLGRSSGLQPYRQRKR